MSSTFAFRYDTLAGHIERGSEWFILTRDHATGDVAFRIAAAWRPGDFPNWWSRSGFRLLPCPPAPVRLLHPDIEQLEPAARRLVTDGPRVSKPRSAR